MATLNQIDTACALLEIGAHRLLTDPVFDAAGGRYHFGWGALSKKLGTPALQPEQLGRIDAVLLTHDQHGDNLDRAGRKVALQATRLLSTTACKLKNAERLAPWAKTILRREGEPDLSITATPAQHHPFWIPELIAGKVIGFLLESSALAGPIWISGDTVMFSGIREVAARHRIDVAILHVGCVRFPWLTGPARYTFDAKEAALAAKLTGARKIVALHTAGWTHFHQGAVELRAAFSRAGMSERLHIPVPGQEMVL